MATIASISVSLVAKTKPFVKGLLKASKKAAGFAKKIGGLAAKIGGLALAGAGLAGIFSFGRSLKDLDKIAKLSKATGIATDELQVLDVVAARGGVELNQISKTALKLSGFAFDAMIAKTADAQRIFKALGVTNQELNANMGSTSALLGLVTGKWNAMEDGVTKTAIAQKLFGGRMAQVVAAFPKGATTISQVREELEELGLIMSPERFADIEAFNDRMDDITRIFSGFSDALTGGAAGKGKEFLDGLFAKLKAFIKEKGGLQNFADTVLANIAEKFKIIVDNVKAFVEQMRQLGKIAKKFQSVASFFGLFGKSPLESAGKGAQRFLGPNNPLSKLEIEDPQIADVIKELAGLREDVKAGGGFV